MLPEGKKKKKKKKKKKENRHYTLAQGQKLIIIPNSYKYNCTDDIDVTRW